MNSEIAAHPAGARNDGPLGEVAGLLRSGGKEEVTKVTTGQLRCSDKRGREVTEVEEV